MIKIKLLEYNLHRNETTFRYYWTNKELFKQVGIEFVLDSDDYDYAFVGQASIIDKKLPLNKSIKMGLNFLKKITGDYIIIDGQDSTSLMGTIDIFRESKSLLFLKTVYLKDFKLYKKGWVNGRKYWGVGDYSVPDIEILKSKMKLTGTNWGNTFFPTGQFKFYPYNDNKKYDLCGMFQYPLKKLVYEHKLCQTPYYNKCRKPVYDLINNSKYNACKLIDGQRIPENEYIQNMYDSKIIFSPYGFGAYGAPRDIQAHQFGSVLIKPRIDWINTNPNMYVENETYIACKEDFSDLEEKVDYVLSNYKELQSFLTENARKKLIEVYNPKNLVLHTYNIFKELKEITV
jgi:hypothetical protein